LPAQEAATWTVSPASVELGADDNDLFESVRHGRLFPDGHVVVADTRGLFVRVYGPNGRRTAAFGRRGSGPGEFTAIMGLWLTRDGRIGVWDGGRRRVTTFERTGRLVATHSVRAPQGMPGSFEIFFGSLRNGDLLLGSLQMPGRPAPNQIIPERWHLGRFSSTGEFRAAIGQVSGMHRTHRTPLPFTPVTRLAVAGDSFWVAEGYDAALQLRNAAGQVVRTVELPWRVHPASNQWSHLESQLREQKKTLSLELLDLVPRPDQVPAVGGTLLDDRGHLWVKEYDPLIDSLWIKGGNALEVGPGGWWRIMSPAGAWVARVRLPDNLIPLDIAGNRLLGVARDAFDVEHIVVHTIARSQ
jgi:hypothetical protein